MKVTFIGAGPGDPKLITLKAVEAIKEAPMIIYAGSLINPEILNYAECAKETQEIHDSASLSLDDMKILFQKAKDKNWNVARLQSGDPSYFGAINEQMAILDDLEISYSVIPGVSSMQAAAAALKTQYTVPGICQTVTITRIAGQTPVPEKEDLEKIAAVNPTLVLFLSAGKLKEAVEKLIKHYKSETPVAVVYRVSWPDEKIIRGSLDTILDLMKSENITQSALIIVGEALSKPEKKSLLYDKNFKHQFRT
ncbi:MAG: precorrin-4 C(11)-methyltransferase [Spirochaetia bacterium]|nr:precorrin-4 C(11)-methyltransferase [Spirochaetia bacterium]